jgi:TIGR03009 family protein
MTYSFLLCATISAGPATVVTAPGLDPRLAGHLTAWQTRERQVTSVFAEGEMVRKNTLTRREDASSATVMRMKPDRLWVQVRRTVHPADFEAYISDGKSLFCYHSAVKSVMEFRTPMAVTDTFPVLDFLSGQMTADRLARRFDLKLAREEESYVQIQVMPRTPKDAQRFESMLLVLYTPAAARKLGADLAYLPKRLRVVRLNGQDMEEWTFADRQKVNNSGVTADCFQFQEPPEGWKKRKWSEEFPWGF